MTTELLTDSIRTKGVKKRQSNAYRRFKAHRGITSTDRAGLAVAVLKETLYPSPPDNRGADSRIEQLNAGYPGKQVAVKATITHIKPTTLSSRIIDNLPITSTGSLQEPPKPDQNAAMKIDNIAQKRVLAPTKAGQGEPKENHPMVISNEGNSKVELEEKLRAYLCYGKMGTSAEDLARAVIYGERSETHPRDPADLGRMIRLFAAIPEIKQIALQKLELFSTKMQSLLYHWDRLEEIYNRNPHYYCDENPGGTRYAVFQRFMDVKMLHFHSLSLYRRKHGLPPDAVN